MLKTIKIIRKHLCARNIRSIRVMKWTDQFIPIIQEEMYPLSDPDTIEQLAYFRAVSLVDLLSDLAKMRKSELALSKNVKDTKSASRSSRWYKEDNRTNEKRKIREVISCLVNLQIMII